MIALAALVCAAAPPLVIDDVTVEIGDGTTRDHVTVVVEGGRIRAVGEAPPLPAGAQRLDGRGKVLAPGFIETLTQLGLSEIGLEKSTNDFQAEGLVLTPAFRAADGFNPRSPRVPISREGGITSAVVSPLGKILFGTGAFADLTGRLADAPSPVEPVALFGALDREGTGGARGVVWMRLRQAFADVRLWSKHRAAWEQQALRTLALGPADLEALSPVVEGRLPLVLYADRASDIRAALGFAREEKIRLIIARGTEAHLVASELAAAKVPVILKPSEQAPYDFDKLAARDDAPALLAKAGVPLVLSATDWDQNIRRLRQEAGIAVANGLAHAAAIRAITLTPAEIFAKGRDLGSVAVGKRANLVLWSGDPLELASVPELILIDGEPMSRETRQLELVRRYRRLAP